MSEPIRAHVLAEEFGISPDELVALAASVRIELRNNRVRIDANDAERIRRKARTVTIYPDGRIELGCLVRNRRPSARKRLESGAVFPRESTDHLRQAERMRREFFEQVEKHAPRVRDSLKNDVWPAFSAMWSRHRNTLLKMLQFLPLRVTTLAEIWATQGEGEEYDLEFDTEPGCWHAHADFLAWFDERLAEGDQSIAAVREAVDDWMEQHHIPAEWVASAALRNLCEWELDPSRADERSWVVPPAAYPFIRTDVAEVCLPDLSDVAHYGPDLIKKRYLESFEEMIDDYIRELNEEAEAMAIPAAKMTRADPRAVKWLVRHQVARRISTVSTGSPLQTSRQRP